ncbi:MAG TPA: hypothetical protein VMC48_02510 [Methanobacterium sp.]|nr:hypothetical protein [Methanobacterium sp.]
MVDESDELSEARSLAEYIAGSVNQVYAGGNGHKIKISIPYQLNKNHNYEVKVNGSGVLIDLNGRKGLAYIIPEKISADENNLKNSTIILYPGNSYYIINKKEGKGDNWIVILHE